MIRHGHKLRTATRTTGGVRDHTSGAVRGQRPRLRLTNARGRAPTAAAAPVRRGRRWRRRALGASVGLVIGLWFAHAVVLPWLVRDKVGAALAGLGLADARFTVERASFWGVRLTGITAAGGDVRVGSLDVAYRPLAVMAGELDTVRLSDAEVRLTVRDGQVSVGLPGAPRGAGVAPASPIDERGRDARATAQTGAIPALPFRRLELASSTVHLNWDGQLVRLPVSGSVDHRGGGGADVALAVSLTPADLAAPGGAKLRRLAGVLHLGGRLRPDGGDVFLRGDSWIGFRALETGDGGRVGETRVAFSGEPDEPLAAARFGEDGLRLRGTLRARSDGLLMLRTPGVDANLGELTGFANVTAEPGKPVSANVELGVAGAAVRHAASGLSLAGISARVPVSVNAPATGAGTFEIASVRRGDETFEFVRGTLGVLDGRAAFSANWAPLPYAVLGVTGWLESGAAGVAGEIEASVPSFRLEDGEALARRVPALDGWAVTGTFAADAKLVIDGGQLIPRATLDVAGVDANSKTAGVELKGVTGAVTLGSLAPLATAGGQRLSADRLAFGAVELADASLGFRADGDGTVLIEQAEAGWLGGRVFTRDVPIDPAAPRVAATLYAERLSLREILALAAGGRATGEGTMSGELPVAVEWPPRVRVGTGHLYADAPAGTLRFTDTALLGQLLDESDPRFATDRELAEVKDRVVRALSDFAYDRLTFDFADGEPGGLVRVHTHGKGRAGADPQELDLTLNVRGGNDLLNHYLRAKTTWDELAN